MAKKRFSFSKNPEKTHTRSIGRVFGRINCKEKFAVAKAAVEQRRTCKRGRLSSFFFLFLSFCLDIIKRL